MKYLAFLFGMVIALISFFFLPKETNDGIRIIALIGGFMLALWALAMDEEAKRQASNCEDDEDFDDDDEDFDDEEDFDEEVNSNKSF